jgi:hypothetical protein
LVLGVHYQVGSDNARQLLGMKGAAETDDIWKIRVQLMKPVTWIPLIWGTISRAPHRSFLIADL